MKFLNWILKKLFNSETDDTKEDVKVIPEPKEPLKNLPPISAFEIRRTEISNSTEPIEGIFYIYKDVLIPDYYSECVESDSLLFKNELNSNDRRMKMYHSDFYNNYMKIKYPELSNDENSIPRGRVNLKPVKTLYIDKCYMDNKDILAKIIDLYRLPDSIIIFYEYYCMQCKKNALS